MKHTKLVKYFIFSGISELVQHPTPHCSLNEGTMRGEAFGPLAGRNGARQCWHPREEKCLVLALGVCELRKGRELRCHGLWGRGGETGAWAGRQQAPLPNSQADTTGGEWDRE